MGEQGLLSIGTKVMEYLDNLKFLMSEEYISASTTASIVVGVIAAIMIIAAAVLQEKKVFGIITGIMQILGAYAAQKLAHFLPGVDFYRTGSFVGSSEAEVEQQINNFYATYAKDSATAYIMLFTYASLMIASWFMLFLFVEKLGKTTHKAVGTVGAILVFVKGVLISPINLYLPLFQKATEATQQTWDIVFYAATIFVCIFTLVAAIIGKFKANNAPIEESVAEGVPAAEGAEAAEQEQIEEE